LRDFATKNRVVLPDVERVKKEDQGANLLLEVLNLLVSGLSKKAQLFSIANGFVIVQNGPADVLADVSIWFPLDGLKDGMCLRIQRYNDG